MTDVPALLFAQPPHAPRRYACRPLTFVLARIKVTRRRALVGAR